MKKTIILLTFFILSTLSFSITLSPISIYDSEGLTAVKERMKYYKKQIEIAEDNFSLGQAEMEYEDMLGKELTTIYEERLSKLDSKEKLALKNSQLKWLEFKDKSMKYFFATNPDNSGSGYGSEIRNQEMRMVIDRIEQLYDY